jgi:Flp pilus assembly CpaF family ATPase
MFLSRSEEPNFKKIINKEEIYIKLMSQTYLPKEKSKREKALKLVDKLLKQTNFYEINVNMGEESAKMTYEEIIKDEIK